MDADAQAEEPAGTGSLDALVLLPRFIIRRADGLYVDVALLEARTDFAQFADRVFTTDALFSGLDYPLFLSLCYEPEAIHVQARSGSGDRGQALRFARDIVTFAPERRAIYHQVKFSRDGSAAEYQFEPVSATRSTVQPVFGPPAEDGSLPILRYETRSETVRTRLDLDEFIAAMWAKDVRFGIDIKAVAAAIARDGTERLEIAREKKCVAGTDASVKEQTKVLHQDNAPKILSDGRVDLARFNNHFPQVSEGSKLLKKLPQVFGLPGFSVKGSVIEPELPKDFDIDSMAGPGTRIERTQEGEFIVAAITGFVNIDAGTNAISVSEKIVSRQGVSVRTTGDLNLSGSDFEEHGEVQEQRQVKGHNMSFFADVFGEVLSNGGAVLLKARLTGGSVLNPNGSVVVETSASGATIEAKHGEIEIAAADGCLIIGSKVRIKKAINCVILGEDVAIGDCEACAIAGRRVTIDDAGSRRDVETVVTVLLPDGAAWNREIEALGKKISELGTTRGANEAVLAQLTEQPEVKKFFALQEKLMTVTMSPEQEASWKAMQTRFAKVTRQVAILRAEISSMVKQEQDLARRVTELEVEKAHAEGESWCHLGAVSGEAVVRTLRAASDGFPLEKLPAKEVHKLLRAHGSPLDKLFSGSEGSFSWPAQMPAV